MKLNNFSDEYLPPLSTIEQRSLAVLQQLPFLVEFNMRVLILRDLCRTSVMAITQGLGFHHRDFLAGNAIVIRRTHLYEDAFEKLSVQNGVKFVYLMRMIVIFFYFRTRFET